MWDEAAENVLTGHKTSSLMGSPRQPLHHKDFVGMLLLQFAHHFIETVVQLVRKKAEMLDKCEPAAIPSPVSSPNPNLLVLVPQPSALQHCQSGPTLYPSSLVHRAPQAAKAAFSRRVFFKVGFGLSCHLFRVTQGMKAQVNIN